VRITQLLPSFPYLGAPHSTPELLSPGGEFAGMDTAPGVLLRLVHFGDTMVPVDPVTLGQRLQTAGFDEVEVKKRLGEFRFRAHRGRVLRQRRGPPGAQPDPPRQALEGADRGRDRRREAPDAPDRRVRRGGISPASSPPSRSMVTEGKRVTVCRARKLSQDRHTRSVVSVNGRNITRCLRDSERCEAYTEIPERAARQHSGDDRRRSDSEARTGGERTARARHRSIAALTRGIGGAGLVVGERRRNELGQLLSDGLRERLARLASSPTEARRP
jgi:hypothetical protein